MIQHRRTALGFIACLIAIAGCSDCNDDTSCFPYGTYVDSNDSLGVASARICLDDDCRTLLPGEGDGNMTKGFYRNDWDDGRKFDLTIEVFVSDGAMIDRLNESRTMDSGRCYCGVLQYGWRDGKLYRIH